MQYDRIERRPALYDHGMSRILAGALSVRWTLCYNCIDNFTVEPKGAAVALNISIFHPLYMHEKEKAFFLLNLGHINIKNKSF